MAYNKKATPKGMAMNRTSTPRTTTTAMNRINKPRNISNLGGNKKLNYTK